MGLVGHFYLKIRFVLNAEKRVFASKMNLNPHKKSRISLF